ncbi:helix-turn-helix domain-containing protein [Hymenobacter psoromatis]|uniref:helix-turn-helix domain-containing protein n=1 Tax=Hymenobacter psoromatis TaxID=1484116 RepID=UPI001CBA7789|nr:helix-turn-helix domain-containing protein [Hymenobacter psoromatis]
MKEGSALAEKIVAHRQRLGLSQENLAEASNLSLRTVQRIEKNETLPRGFTLQALAAALQLSVEDLTAASSQVAAVEPAPVGVVDAPEEVSAYVALMYLSCFSYVFLPGANIVLPLWLRYRKRHNLEIQKAGSQLLNFELVWTLVTYGGYLLLLAAQIGLILYFHIVLVMTPLVFLFSLNLAHAPLLLIGAHRARQGRYGSYPMGLRLF